MNFYEIQVKGVLESTWSDWLGGMTITALAGGVTQLSGPVPDQAALQGILLQLHNLGLTLLSVQCVENLTSQPDFR